jgi:hypothetical protein
MTCEESIKNNLCLGCGLEIINNNADKCEYRESGLDMCKKIIEGVQMKL